jgi:putative RNA 2'-phosphotransferase
MPINPVELSRFLSFILRHSPASIGISLDACGWTSIHELIKKSDVAGSRFAHEEVLQIVNTSDKRRFSISADGLRIRAAHGHSVPVELGLPSSEPPTILYHGTATRFVDSILSNGLKPRARRQVHLSADGVTAQRVGRRHGTPVVLEINALGMHAKGFEFNLAENGVWLTDHVPPEFLTLSSSSADSATASRHPKLSM